MAWTQADLDAVKAAVIALATGQRTASVSFSGGGSQASRTVSYVPAQLPELRALMAEISRAVGTTTTFRHVTFGKGFDRRDPNLG